MPPDKPKAMEQSVIAPPPLPGPLVPTHRPDAASVSAAATVIAGIAAALALLIALVATFPANWIAHWVQSRTSGMIVLGDARGTLWRGSAVLGLSSAALAMRPSETSPRMLPGSLSLPGRLEWQVEFPTRFTPVLRLQHNGVLLQPVLLHATLRAITIDAGAITVPLSLAILVGAPLNTVKPEGIARIEWSSMVVPYGKAGPGPVAPASGTIRLSNVSSSMTPALAAVRPLGEYRIGWHTGGPAPSGRIDLNLTTERGPLRIEGRGTVELSGRQAGTVFSGRAMIDPGTPAFIAQRLSVLLDMLGRRVNPNSNEVMIQIAS